MEMLEEMPANAWEQEEVKETDHITQQVPIKKPEAAPRPQRKRGQSRIEGEWIRIALAYYAPLLSIVAAIPPFRRFFLESTLGNVVLISLLFWPLILILKRLPFLQRLPKKWFSTCIAILSTFLLISVATNILFLSFIPRATTSMDKCSGLVLNGCFEKRNFEHWTHGGELPRSVVDNPNNGKPSFPSKYGALLGTATECVTQTASSARMSQMIYIPEDMRAPVLSFQYRIFTNDILSRSSFHVEIRDGNNVGIREVREYGYNPRTSEAECGKDLGWMPASFDLSPYKGQVITLWFENRNEDGAHGIWTYVGEIKVHDLAIR